MRAILIAERSPGSKSIYVALNDLNTLGVIDIATMTLISHIPVSIGCIPVVEHNAQTGMSRCRIYARVGLKRPQRMSAIGPLVRRRRPGPLGTSWSPPTLVGTGFTKRLPSRSAGSNGMHVRWYVLQADSSNEDSQRRASRGHRCNRVRVTCVCSVLRTG